MEDAPKVSKSFNRLMDVRLLFSNISEIEGRIHTDDYVCLGPFVQTCQDDGQALLLASTPDVGACDTVAKSIC